MYVCDICRGAEIAHMHRNYFVREYVCAHLLSDLHLTLPSAEGGRQLLQTGIKVSVNLFLSPFFGDINPTADL